MFPITCTGHTSKDDIGARDRTVLWNARKSSLKILTKKAKYSKEEIHFDARFLISLYSFASLFALSRVNVRDSYCETQLGH